MVSGSAPGHAARSTKVSYAQIAPFAKLRTLSVRCVGHSQKRTFGYIFGVLRTSRSSAARHWAVWRMMAPHARFWLKVCVKNSLAFCVTKKSALFSVVLSDTAIRPATHSHEKMPNWHQSIHCMSICPSWVAASASSARTPRQARHRAGRM